MKLTLKGANRIMERTGGSLDLSGKQIKYLPKGLVVGGSLYLSNTPIKYLPKGLVVGGSLCLSNTPIKDLPKGLVVGGSLDLRYTQIRELPAGLVVGGWLYLSNTWITELPAGIVVGGWLCLSKMRIENKSEAIGKARKLTNGTIAENYIYADDMLFHYAGKKHILGDYTVYAGKIPNQYLVSDGEYWAHCKTAREGIADILFKKAKDRGAEQYKGLDLDAEYTVDELKTMYRVITGACRAGTEAFVASVRDLKERYTIREAIEITKGQYNSDAFASFFRGLKV